jgi:hypothetical protein
LFEELTEEALDQLQAVLANEADYQETLNRISEGLILLFRALYQVNGKSRWDGKWGKRHRILTYKKWT